MIFYLQMNIKDQYIYTNISDVLEVTKQFF